MNRQLATTLIASLAIVIPGCLGTEESAVGATADVGDVASGDLVTEARAVEHALGTLTIEGTPARVVAIEWPYVEMLLALGVQPVGVADVAGYTELVSTEPALAADVVDVGTRQEPNLEAIAALEPDLIVGVKFRHEKIHESLSAIAPTLIFDTFPPGGDHYENMRSTVVALADALGRPQAGAAALAGLDAAIDEASARLEAAGQLGRPFVLAQVLAAESGQIRLFQDHQVAVALIEELGIENAWQDEANDKGFSTVGLEALQTVERADFLYVLSSGASLEAYAANPAWGGLDFVEEGRTFDLSGAWLLAGPLSGQAFVERVVDALAPAAEGPRTITHALGELTIEGTPARIVALEWTYAEDLLALGVQPVGVADVAGYNSWVNVEVALADSVTDVGTRQEPNLEAIAALEPDLIIGVKFRHEKIHDTLSSIAPTLIFDPYPTEDAGLTQYAEMEQTFLAIADALNREPKAERVLADLDQHYADAHAALDDAGFAGREIVVAQAFTFNDNAAIRVFTQNALASTIIERVGLVNAWNDGYQTYGFSTIGVEALVPVEHADFFYVVQANDDVFANQYADHPVWTDLRFVEEERTYALGGDTWLFGGPLSAKVVVDKLVAAYGAA